ncbi:hypothetical protein L6259_01365 [Candidatus Parcubacteria bacterium]|nr:hypothetical protein [Candidatus Parcubacteria bacterium]
MPEEIKLKVPEEDYRHEGAAGRLEECIKCGHKMQQSIWAKEQKGVCPNCGFLNPCCE